MLSLHRSHLVSTGTSFKCSSYWGYEREICRHFPLFVFLEYDDAEFWPQNNLRIIVTCSPPKTFFPPEAEAHISILINDIVNPPEVEMFRHSGKDIVAGGAKYIGVPKGDMLPLPMPPLPIPLIPNLTDNESSIFDTTEWISVPTQSVGFPPLNIEVQEPEGLYLVQDKVEARHGENRRSHLNLLLLLRILPVFSSFPPFVFWLIWVVVQFR